MSRSVKIALMQFSSVIGGKKVNVKKAIDMINIADQKGAKIICFPETFSTGYDLDFFKGRIPILAESISGYTITALRAAAKAKKVYIIAPIILKKEGENIFTNSAVVIDDNGGVIGTYSKNHLWHLGEEDLFTKGRDYPVFKTKYGTFGIIICYDLNMPEASRILTLNGAEIIFQCSAWIQNDKYMYDTFIPSRALENEVFFASVNHYDESRNLFGNSKIANPKGSIVVESSRKGEDVLVHKIDLDEVEDVRKNAPFLSQRRPWNYEVLCK